MKLRFAIAFATCVAAAQTALAVSNTIVISQIYGGGGNSGATYKNDFVELYNRGTTTINVTGWSVQYASTAGTSWQVTSLSGSIAPGHYYLIQEAAGAGGTTNLPTPDATGGIQMSATGGKVALVNGVTAQTGSGCPFAASVVDFIGYDGANCFEGAAASALTNTTAALRTGNGCTDTDNNAADFSSGAPNPRNSSSPTNSCGGANNPPSINTPANPIATVTQNAAPFNVSLSGSDDNNVFNWSATSGAGIANVIVASGQGTSNITYTVTLLNNFSGTATFTASLSDNANPAVTKPVNIQVNPVVVNNPPTITPPANPITTVAHDAQPFSVSLTGNDDGGIYNWSVTAGTGLASVSVTGGQGTSIATFTVNLQAAFSGTADFTASLSDNFNPPATQIVRITVTPPPPPTTVKISQVYGGGGNSGSTYQNDFIELYNSGTTPVSVDGWSVQATSASATSWTANGPATPLNGTIQPGHYYLIQESQGAGGTTPLPTADATGIITMSATNAKVALVAGTTVLTGDCPAGGSIVDFVGYGSATCFETAPVTALSNTTAAIRKGNGCIDTDNNFNDFVVIGPIPRNGASPVNSCGGDPTMPSGLGLASPGSLEATGSTLLTVNVTPATTPASTGLTVAANLLSISGPSSQTFFDDGTHGDLIAGDNIFTFQATIPGGTPFGVKSIVATITDAQGRTATAPITITVQSPTCGVERWAVKVGTDPDAATVNLNAIPGMIADLGTIPAPPDPPGPPLNARVAPTETNVYVVNATMTLYKKESDVDYHIVLQDNTNPVHTLIAEIPSPACAGTSPFAAAIANARATFDARLTATPFFQTATLPVQIKGIGFFDFIHGQTGVAPNGIELHPVLEVNFTTNTTTSLTSSANPSQYGQQVAITATVIGGANTPTGNVTFFDGGHAGNTRILDQSGHAILTLTSLSVGSHSLTASYEGDSKSAPSNSTQLIQVVNKADQTISFGILGSKIYGDSDFVVNATASSGLSATFSMSGPATIAGNVVHITAAGSVTVRASQAGDDNYNAAHDVDQSFDVAKATPTVTVSGGPFAYDGMAKNASATANGVAGASVNGTFGFTYSASPTPPTNAGTYNVVASFTSNDSNYANATGAGSIIINKATPTVTVSGGPFTYDGTAKNATAKATGIGGASVNGNFSFTYNRSPTAPTNIGTYTVVATFNSSDDNYDNATDNGSIVINVATPTVTVGGRPFTYDGTAKNATATATGAGGASVSGSFSFTYNGSSTAPMNAATYAVVATFTSSDNNYGNATGNGSIVINKATPTVTVSGGPFTYDGTAKSAAATAMGAGGASVSGSFSFTYTGSSTAPMNAGTYAVVATFTSSDNNYGNATGNGSIVINKATPSVGVSGGPFTYDGMAKSATGTAYGIGGASIAGSFAFTYNGSSTAPTNAGTYSVAASFTSADTNYLNANGVGSIVINKAAPSVTVSGGPFVYDATAKNATAGAMGAGAATVVGSFAFTYNSSAAAPTNAGNYAVVATFTSNDGNYSNATGNGSITINKAMPMVSVSGGPFTYDTIAKTATATATGVRGALVAGSFAFTYNGSAASPTLPGSYAIVARFTSADGNYNNTIGNGTIVIGGLRDSLQDVIRSLTRLRDTTTARRDIDKLNDAIEHLAESIDPELWLDSIHPSREGEGIFSDTKDAINPLSDLLKDRNSSVPAVQLQPLVNQIATDDRVLALTGINEAVARGGNSKDIDKARGELATGDSDIASGKYDSGIEHYRNAWSKATKA